MNKEEVIRDTVDVHRENFRVQGENKYKSTEFLNNWVISASLGSFALSLAFIEKLQPMKYVFFLYLAWIGFITTVVFIIVNYVISIELTEKMQRQINNVVRDNPLADSEKYNVFTNEGPFKSLPKLKWRLFQRIISYITLSFFCMALISSVVFAIINANNGVGNDNTKEMIINNYYQSI